MEIFGIKFAPVWIPFERRLQTLAVLFWIFCFLFLGPISSSILIYLLWTPYRWITILYVTWVIYDFNTPYNGGRKTAFLYTRNWWLWRFYGKFFPIELVKTVDLDPNKSYLFGSHPHGILCSGAFCAFATEALGFSKLFPGLNARLLTLQGQYTFPNLIYRETMLGTGACAATKVGMENLFKQEKGLAAVLVPGGALEALNSDEDKIRLVLNRRKGFIKLALRFGVNLVPTFSFGENFIYDQVKAEQGSWLQRFQYVTEKWIGFTPVVFFGRGIFQYNWGLLPHRKPVTVVVGKPLFVEKVENPSKEQIENLHKNYVQELTKLYDEYNPKYGDTNVKLLIE